MENSLNVRNIAFVGSYLPRRCGIATFTADICEAIAAEFPAAQCIVGAVNDEPGGYEYPERVRFELDQQDLDSYRRAAEFLNINNVEVVSVQHEFGIYGGPAGSHLLAFLRELHMPVVTTLHTILAAPNSEQRAVMAQLDAFSNRFIVMADRGRLMLETVYGVDPAKIDLIPHGVIDMPFIDSNFYKDLFDVEGKTVLLTFGLLSPNKGIEYVIEALPAILARHPNVVYLILGATHPHLIAREGEAYRKKLAQLAEDIGVKDQVIFHNRFVTLEELKEFIGAADIYITPYLNEAQVTSGTLAYTFGAGKAIISTPYWHAQEMLAGDRRRPCALSRCARDRRGRESLFVESDAHDGDPQTRLESRARDDLAGGRRGATRRVSSSLARVSACPRWNRPACAGWRTPTIRCPR